MSSSCLFLTPSPTTVLVHRRQFVIGPEAFKARDDWQCASLDDSLRISHCPELRLRWARDAEGILWVLLGLAIETLEEDPDPVESIARTRTAEIPDLYPSWAGRWMLIGQGKVHMDASGLLGCFYSCGSEGSIWASSSPALLARIVASTGTSITDPRRLHYERGISWFPPPQSRFRSISRLLSSQLLDLRDGSVGPRPLMPPVDPSQGFDLILDAVGRRLTTATLRLARDSGGLLWLGLTAGLDSRLMLAIARAAGVPVRPFTRLYSGISVADRVLPPKLARQCGLEHIYCPPLPRPPNRAPLVTEHCADHVSPGDAEPILSGARDALEGISVGGHCFEAVKGFSNWRLLPKVVPPPSEGAEQIAALLGEPRGSTALSGLRKWLQWVHETPHEGLDWRDRMYFEQRLAGWESSKEQLHDLVRLVRFPILNSARIYSLLLGLDESRRIGSRIQVELIRRLAPDLLAHPANPADRHFILTHPFHACRSKAVRTSRQLHRRFQRAIAGLSPSGS